MVRGEQIIRGDQIIEILMETLGFDGLIAGKITYYVIMLEGGREIIYHHSYAHNVSMGAPRERVTSMIRLAKYYLNWRKRKYYYN